MATQKGTRQVWSLLVPEASAELGSVTALCGPGSLALSAEAHDSQPALREEWSYSPVCGKC